MPTKTEERSRRGPLLALFTSWVTLSKSSPTSDSPTRKCKTAHHGRPRTTSSEKGSPSSGWTNGRSRADSGNAMPARVPLPSPAKAPATVASRTGRSDRGHLDGAFRGPDSNAATYGASSARRPLPPMPSALSSTTLAYGIPRVSLDTRSGASEVWQNDLAAYPPNRPPPPSAAIPIHAPRHAKSQSDLGAVHQQQKAAFTAQDPKSSYVRRVPVPPLPRELAAQLPPTNVRTEKPIALSVPRPGSSNGRQSSSGARPGSSNGRQSSSGARPGSAGGSRPGSAGRDGPRQNLPIGPSATSRPRPEMRPEMWHTRSHSTIGEQVEELPPLPVAQRVMPVPPQYLDHQDHQRPRTSSRAAEAPSKSSRPKRRHLAVRPATADDTSRKKRSTRGEWNLDDIEEVRRRLRELR
ncbi:hypothetical protein BD626DRAFT_566916 [Schizophyllum amplum]|uniref:Uncharacterized protein n=1 Tax=Schizophyllum amplum TaxID=97359 RepID=A0A550CNJ2_9AGAR|nr:hypothetical protein BD626DRAFT_566916 [Auriculariopsis ampla]